MLNRQISSATADALFLVFIMLVMLTGVFAPIVSKAYESFKAPDSFEEYLEERKNRWFYVDKNFTEEGVIRASKALESLEILRKDDISDSELRALFGLYKRLCQNFRESNSRGHADRNERWLLNYECSSARSPYRYIRRTYLKRIEKAT